MKKLLSLFSALTLTSVSVASVVSCQEMPYYLNYISGVDTIVYTNSVKRDKDVRRVISSNESDITVSINGAKTGEFVVFSLAKSMRLLWSFQDKNSIIFGSNNLVDYSTWDYIVPYNSRLDIAKKQAINFTEKYYKYVIVPVWAETEIGEILQVLDEDNKFYGFALNLQDFAKSERPKLDLSLLSPKQLLDIDVTDVINALRPYEDKLNFKGSPDDFIASFMWLLLTDQDVAQNLQNLIQNFIKFSVKQLLTMFITAGLKGQDVNLRVMSECAKSLSEVPEYQDDLGGLFHLFFNQWDASKSDQKVLNNVANFIPDKAHQAQLDTKKQVLTLLYNIHMDLTNKEKNNVSDYELEGEINRDLVGQIIQMDSIEMSGKSSLHVNFINRGKPPGKE